MHERLISPAALLASLASATQSAPELALVTGRIGSGKTTWCLDLLREARPAGLSPAGLISPGVYRGGLKTGIDLMDVATGERRRLAVKRDASSRRQVPGPATLSWRFDPAVLAWGNQILERLVAPELLILDELGPLEFRDNCGLTAGLSCIDKRHYRLACVVIRLALLPAALERWPWGRVWEAAGQSPEVSRP